MNSNDPSKKASINSLLNPQHEYNYSLRAASWDIPQPTIQPKHPDPPPRHYHPNIPAPHIYSDSHAPRLMRNSPSTPHRFDNNYHYQSHSHSYHHHNSWPLSPPQTHPVQYPPMYSDERTGNYFPHLVTSSSLLTVPPLPTHLALPGDYHSHSSSSTARLGSTIQLMATI